MQELANRRTELRFEYLLRELGREDAIWPSFQSVSNISDRLQDGWLSSEEVALKQENRVYDDLTAEIDDLQRLLDTGALDGAFRDAQQDREYLDARLAIQNRVRELDNELLTSATRHGRQE
jgi:hypothetical protein